MREFETLKNQQYQFYLKILLFNFFENINID